MTAGVVIALMTGFGSNGGGLAQTSNSKACVLQNLTKSSVHFVALAEGRLADAQRHAALVECANDPAFDAVWFARGGYGSPTIFVDTAKMYFGNDQLPLVEFALKDKPA